MRINPDTLLFEDIAPHQAAELKIWAENVVLRGKVANPDPSPIAEWFAVAKVDHNQRLLVISTALPQKVLLSLLYWTYGNPTERGDAG